MCNVRALTEERILESSVILISIHLQANTKEKEQ